jgi:acyl-CoA synthetase (AMP-forming)/AMP-acid ligase II/alkylation response protein AidB-like acyl-CoA dehydrogenase
MRRATEQGDDLAYAFLTDGSIANDRLTFSGLDRRARSIAAALLDVADPGDRALLVFESGLDFVATFMGCLYAGVVAIPIPAPQGSRVQASLPRMRSIAGDSTARLLLGNARTLQMLREVQGDLATIEGAGWIDTGSISPRSDFSPRRPNPEALAYLQYTSGSTADPKGVMISHANLIGHTASMREALHYDASSVSVSWMPHFHDYGLIEGIILPLFNGTPAYLISPFAFLKRPLCWLRAMDRYRGTHTQGPNFAYRYCVRRIPPDQRSDLDLSSLQSAGNGGEPIHPETSEEFFTAFAPCGLRREALRPAYGLAEATLMVTASPMSQPPLVGRFDAAALARGVVVPADGAHAEAVEIASCGRPIGGVQLAIVEPESSRRVSDSRVGEIWVRAGWLAKGYWLQPAETQATFDARIAGEDGSGHLRTGDLGFVFRGELYVTARRKDLIIIRGLNHYPPDIEWTVQRAHPALRADHGAAFGVDVQGEDRLCIVQELLRASYPDRELDDIVAAILEAVGNAHGVAVQAVALIERGSLPKTTSGKVQRHASRDALLGGSLRVTREWRAEGFAPEPRPVSPRNDAPASNGAAASEPPEPPGDGVAQLLTWLREYAEERINSRLIDERRCIPPHVILDLGNRGFFGLQAPRSYGGLELSHAETARVLQQLGAIDLSLATLVFLHNSNGIRPILDFATTQLREELMPLLASGRELAAFALSEPVAGSNLGATQTRARPIDHGEWLLNGVKRWNGSGWAGVISGFARTESSEGRLRGITGFVLRQSDPGVRVGPEALTMGMRGIMQNTLYLEDVRVPGERVLGEPGKGMRVIETVLHAGRITAAAVASGAIMRCAQLIERYASRREIDTGLLLHNPQTLDRISELLHRSTILRALIARCGTRLDAGEEVIGEYAMALKVSATDTLNFAADLLVQLLGGRGYMENNEASRIMRDARALSIGEGANESLVAAIGRSLRLTEVIPSFLLRDHADPAIAARLRGLAAPPRPRSDPARPGDSADLAWRDALVGRAVCSAFSLLAANSLGLRNGDSASTLEWARAQFDRRCTEAEQAHWPKRSVLPADRIREEISHFSALIGDLEPFAPDVEIDLDPMLRRVPPETRHPPTAPSGSALPDIVALQPARTR